MKFSILIPAYNEGERIRASLEKVLAYVAQRGWAAKIIVVNDGSRDETAAIVKEFAQRAPQLQLLENPGNRGKGYSVRNGMLHATGDVLLFTDADLSSPIEESEKLFHALFGGADVAMGSRWANSQTQIKKQSLLRQIFGRVYNLLLRAALGLPYKDTQCGFKAFTRRAAAEIFGRQRIEGWGFDPEILFLAQRLHLKVAEIPVEWAHDERSKINPVRDGIRMFGEMIGVRWNALRGRYRAPQFCAAAPHEAAASALQSRAASAK